jgi:hypothetical protein
MTTSEESRGFLPTEPPRRQVESALVRVIATLGIIAVGTAVAAIMDAAGVAGWIIGLVVSAVSVILAAILWRRRML